jgi:hypothetical protein
MQFLQFIANEQMSRYKQLIFGGQKVLAQLSLAGWSSTQTADVSVDGEVIEQNRIKIVVSWVTGKPEEPAVRHKATLGVDLVCFEIQLVELHSSQALSPEVSRGLTDTVWLAVKKWTDDGQLAL